MNFKLNLEKYDFTEYKPFDVGLIRFDQVVRNLCRQNKCGQYGKNHMCPPAIKDMDEWKQDILSFKNAVIVTKVYPTKSSFDMKGMLEGARDFSKTLGRIKEDIEKDYPLERKMVLGAGPCMLCKECTLMENKPCRFPDKAFPAIEACGIDVMSLSKTAGVKYNNGKNTVTYLGVILY
jgi:predicted metal-binding protein